MQPDEPAPLPEGVAEAIAEGSWNHGGGEREDATGADSGGAEPPYQGRLEAVKLTGDPNVPRGEYTWIAPDIGRGGLIRTATEEPFNGARIVKCAGHIAARDFRDDKYIPSQLIMVSHNHLAQYWEEFGHISFLRRVDLDEVPRTRGSMLL
ncbi:hypothetical protein BDY21DRAFT_359516 [Lineolata rhizophorae]|uniref:Uncharacterized protein n=1 Tax=Lineolata rhizophorae TaxID=578093 RepID=A0A6A6NLJ4_9PEZI|nr:hypothetical protein BDY21DRAFT_359516 [Lineolata rhizophorae]